MKKLRDDTTHGNKTRRGSQRPKRKQKKSLSRKVKSKTYSHLIF